MEIVQVFYIIMLTVQIFCNGISSGISKWKMSWYFIMENVQVFPNRTVQLNQNAKYPGIL